MRWNGLASEIGEKKASLTRRGGSFPGGSVSAEHEAKKLLSDQSRPSKSVIKSSVSVSCGEMLFDPPAGGTISS